MFFRKVLTTTTATTLLIAGAASAQQVNAPLADNVAEARNATGFVTTGEQVMVDSDDYTVGGQSGAVIEQEILNITEFPGEAEERLSDRY